MVHCLQSAVCCLWYLPLLLTRGIQIWRDGSFCLPVLPRGNSREDRDYLSGLLELEEDRGIAQFKSNRM